MDGLELTLKPLIIACILALLLFFLSCLAWQMKGVEPAKKDAKIKKPEETDKQDSLEAQFENAQRLAVSRLRDDTPEHDKLELYGWYKQAKEGANYGIKPTGVMKDKEKARWQS